jgi:hypothetical protein
MGAVGVAKLFVFGVAGGGCGGLQDSSAEGWG